MTTKQPINRFERHIARKIVESIWAVAKAHSKDPMKKGITTREAFAETDGSIYQIETWFKAWLKTGYMTRQRVGNAFLFTIPTQYLDQDVPPVTYNGEHKEIEFESDNQRMWDMIRESSSAITADVIVQLSVEQGKKINRDYARSYLQALNKAGFLADSGDRYDRDGKDSTGQRMVNEYTKTDKITKDSILAPVIKRGKMIIDPNQSAQQ